MVSFSFGYCDQFHTEGQVEVVCLGRCISSPSTGSPPLLAAADAGAGAFGLWPCGIEATPIVGGCESFRKSSAAVATYVNCR